MKQYKYVLIASLILFVAACKKDNLDPPTSTLTGKVTYQGQPIGVRSTGVQFEIWQSGYQLFTKIPLSIKQDGTFGAELFNGDYKVVRTTGAGPWTDMTDTINVKVNGSATVDIPIEPFFIIKNAVFEKSGSTIKATFTIDKIVTSKTLELARLYIGPNLILDQNNNAANVQLLAAAITVGTPATLSVNIPASIASDNFIFARVGVKTTGVSELLYTMSEKIQLK